MKFFRSRFIIHICGGIAACELLYTLLSQWQISLWFAAIAAPVIGLISEVWDYFHEYPYPNRNWKHFADVMSWVFGGLMFVAIELMKG